MSAESGHTSKAVESRDGDFIVERKLLGPAVCILQERQLSETNEEFKYSTGRYI